MDPSIVHIARRMSRQLQLQKGIFMSPEAMQVLVECGAFDAVQSGATEFLRQQAVRSREERELREAARYMPAGERRSQMHLVDGGAYFEDSRRHIERKLNGRHYDPAGESDSQAAFERVKRRMGMKSAKPLVDTLDPEARESVERTQRMVEAKRQRQTERKGEAKRKRDEAREEGKRRFLLKEAENWERERARCQQMRERELVS